MHYKISPRIDLAFKKIFGVEENKDLLISLLNSIVSAEDQVVEVTLLNPYNAQNFKNDKLSILDIKAKSADGKQFNIEIQITDEADYDKRALYYWGKLYTEQLKTSDPYSLLAKTIGIHILNFTSISASDKYHHSFHLVDEATGLRYFKDIELHTIELNKFIQNSDDDLNSLVAKVKSALDVWAAFLTRNDLLDPQNLPETLDIPDLKKALNVLEVMNLTPEEREVYENGLRWFRTEASALAKMHDKGVAIGKAEGKVEGKVEGKAERDVEIAKNLLRIGMSIDNIATVTGLSRAQIDAINRE
jgi:predicted transposase/invertase (TIGR01784 family)